ncbi:asialoglycoprotein receptor 2-like [Oreochromis aureus]|uniref:asialoglycoprotein receptor 2-like n=1 Tax=Oreochromis aureus TaxID=47969 RepID=UPI0019540196|nr:asialoglycoprotein receptor 2-like [Oreochromis aureus]
MALLNVRSLVNKTFVLNDFFFTSRLDVLFLTETWIRPEKVCPEGWRMFCHSCYVLSEKLGSWDEGRDDCRSKGADLVVIESLEDKTFISSYIKERAWIGLNDKEEEGNWKWVDGTPLTLQNWVAKQPDNGDGNPKWGEEDCVHVEPDASWNDLSCSASLKWICEKHTTE